MPKGHFFVIEGIDGCGKSPVIEGLELLFKEHVLSCLVTHEPQEHQPWGRAFYEAIRNRQSQLKMLQKQELCIQDRLHHLEMVILPALAKGLIVLCDRYFMSTFAYGMPDASYDDLWQAHQDIIGNKLIIPEATFVLDVTVEGAQRRLATKGKPLDQLEKNREGQERTQQNFLDLARDPRFGSVIVTDNMRPRGEAAVEIFQFILQIS